MLDTTLDARVQVFLDKFEVALVAGDLDAAVGMFAPECYWRDLTPVFGLQTVYHKA
jgi:putative flavoprotein involved in K+ transport